MKILQVPCIRGGCMKALLGGSCQVLFWLSCEIMLGVFCNSLRQDLVMFLAKSFQRSLQCMILYRSLWKDLVEILVKCCRGPTHDLVQVLVGRSWRSWWNLLGALAWSRTGPCEKIFWRSCWSPPQEILGLRSWRCSALVLVWKFFWDAHRKFLYENLPRSSI